MVKIAFHNGQIDVRGTSVALYDYAHYNETILGNKSIIVSPYSNLHNNEMAALDKYMNRFQVYFYDSIDNMNDIISDCDILYIIKYGKSDGIISTKIKTVVHCVFDMSQPHGDVYAGVSETLARKFGKTLFVPHMIGLRPSETKDDMRNTLEIPNDAVVFGRHGGMDTFDLQFCRKTISKIVRSYKKIYFILVNTPKFDDHEQIIFLSSIVDEDKKNRFISTCDAHIECGSLGHTFGLSIGEFSVNNKPIIAYNGNMWNKAHIDILGDKGLYYSTEKEFEDILVNFDPKDFVNNDNNAYTNYLPENIMKIFSKVFIE